jgi:parvulin-like peptidyl-prolyl isomerase
VLLTLLAACVLTLAVGCGSSSETPAATVDGRPIWRADVDRTVKTGELTGTPLTRKAAVEHLISEELVRREAERRDISVSPKDVTARLRTVARDAGGQARLKAQLKQAGLTMADFRRSVAAVLLEDRVRDDMFKAITATRAQARAYYDDKRDLFKVAGGVDLGALAVRTKPIAESVIERIRDGQSFESAAHQFSIDPELRDKKGRYGWVSVPTLPAPLRTAVAGLEAGQMSAPVEIQKMLWYVVRLYGRRPAETLPFDEVASGLQDQLTRSKRAKALNAWIKRARADAKVTVHI